MAVAEYFLDVVEGVLHLEARGEGLRLAHIVVADRGDFDARQLAQHGEVRNLGDRPGADDRDPDRRAHRAPGLLPIPAQRHMTPVRKLTLDSPLASTPRAPTVTRPRFAPPPAPTAQSTTAVI